MAQLLTVQRCSHLLALLGWIVKDCCFQSEEQSFAQGQCKFWMAHGFFVAPNVISGSLKKINQFKILNTKSLKKISDLNHILRLNQGWLLKCLHFVPQRFHNALFYFSALLFVSLSFNFSISSITVLRALWWPKLYSWRHPSILRLPRNKNSRTSSKSRNGISSTEHISYSSGWSCWYGTAGR